MATYSGTTAVSTWYRSSAVIMAAGGCGWLGGSNAALLAALLWWWEEEAEWFGDEQCQCARGLWFRTFGLERNKE